MSTTELGRPSDRWRVDFLLGAWQMLPLLISVIPFGLILGAFLLAMLYMFLCKPEPETRLSHIPSHSSATRLSRNTSMV